MPRRKKTEADAAPTERLSDDEARARISTCYDTLEAKIMAGYGPDRGRAEIETWRGFAEAYRRDYPEIWAEVAAQKRKRNQECRS